MKAYWEKRLKQYDKYVAGTWTGKNVDKMLEEVFRIKAQLIDKSQYQAMEYYVTKGYSGNRFNKFFQRTPKGTIKFAKNISSELKQQFTERIFEDVNEVMDDDFQSKPGFEKEISAKTGKDITFTKSEWSTIQEIAERRRQEGQSFRDSLYDVLGDVADTFNMEWDIESIFKRAVSGDALSMLVLKKLNPDLLKKSKNYADNEGKLIKHAASTSTILFKNLIGEEYINPAILEKLEEMEKEFDKQFESYNKYDFMTYINEEKYKSMYGDDWED